MGRRMKLSDYWDLSETVKQQLLESCEVIVGPYLSQGYGKSFCQRMAVNALNITHNLADNLFNMSPSISSRIEEIKQERYWRHRKFMEGVPNQSAPTS